MLVASKNAMKLSRITSVLGVSAAMALSACGSATSTGTTAQSSVTGGSTPAPPSSASATVVSSAVSSARASAAPGSPPVIHVGGHPSGATPAVAAALPVDSKMRVASGSIVYRFAGQLPAFGSSGPSWSMAADQTVAPTRVSQIAAAFGATGEVKQLPADQGGGWQVGSQDGKTPNLTVVADGPLSWYYNPVMSSAGAGATCGSNETGYPSVPSDSAVEPCPPVSPPAGVPTKDAALATATALFAKAGIDTRGETLVVTADEWTATVTASIQLDGHRTQLTNQISFGAEGAVSAASGFLAVPQPNATFPIVGTAAALQRLNDQSERWMTAFGTLGDVAARGGAPAVAPLLPAPVAVTAVAPSTCTPMVNGVGKSDAVPADSIDSMMCPLSPGIAATVPPGTPSGAVRSDAPVAPIEITLTGVRIDMKSIYDADGTVWLLPTYVFTSNDGGEYSVVGIADQYLQNDGSTQKPGPIPAVGTAVVGSAAVSPSPVTS